MKRVALHNLGCKVNGYEMDVMQQKLKQKGYEIVQFDECADIYIVNTCTVTNIADQKSRQMLHRAKKQNPAAIVVAVGCYVQTGEAAVSNDESADLMIGNNRKKDIVDILEEYMAAKESNSFKIKDKTLQHRTVIDIDHTNEYEEMQLTSTRENTRAYIKIQDGCNQFCSYCIIPYARGRARSRREEDIMTEVSGIAAKGYKEIVLTGIHISSYGIDRGGRELLQLLKKLDRAEGIERIRLGSLEAGIITEDFVSEISKLSAICPHFHLSLQSGCDDTLRRMNRHYTTREYLEKVEMLRKYFNKPAITTDVIVGFPGESEEEFNCTRRFLEEVKFYEMHIFKYSKRHGTRAAGMENQIPENIKSERSRELIGLSKKLSGEYRKSMLGENVEILFEDIKEINGRKYRVGHTREYIKAAVESGEDLNNTVLKCRLGGFLMDDIMKIDVSDRF